MSLPPVVCRRTHVFYLRYLCLLEVSNTLCCVFVLFCFFSTCCQFLWIVHFLIAPSVFSNVYLRIITRNVMN